MKIVQNSLEDRFQKDYDMKLKFSGLISVVERIISVKFQQNLRWSPWEV